MELDHRISEPLPGAKLVVLSMGAGVQTCALALMSARGDLPKLDAVIFSDTGDEKRATYRYLDYLEPILDAAGIPLIRTARPGPTLAELAISVAQGERPLAGAGLPPFYLDNPRGMAPKQCNADFKRDQVTREIRKLMAERGIPLESGRPIVEQWVGFTRDELERLSRHRKKYIHVRWPLIEMGMSKADVRRWYELRQLPTPPKSSCVYCPYQGDLQYIAMKENTADDDFERACNVDRLIRPYHSGATGAAYVHRSCRPLADVPLERAPDLFGEFACDSGYCGT